MKPRLMLADDHKLVVQGLRSLLADRFDLVEIVHDGESLVRQAAHWKPDAILLDISMPVLSGIEAARILNRELPEAKLLFVTMHTGTAYVLEAFRAGASGYVLKASAEEELVNAIEAVLAGDIYVTPLLSNDIREKIERRALENVPRDSDLTEREQQVLRLVAQGRSAKEAAAILHISAKTVEFHKYKIMRKLGIRTTPELVQRAVLRGMIDGPAG